MQQFLFSFQLNLDFVTTRSNYLGPSKRDFVTYAAVVVKFIKFSSILYAAVVFIGSVTFQFQSY